MDKPKHYEQVRKAYPDYMDAVDRLGQAIRDQGPLGEKEAQLIQLAASVAFGSEGAAHSHTRRALQAGATPGEVRHCILLLTTTIGFPRTMAGLSWVNDILGA